MTFELERLQRENKRLSGRIQQLNKDVRLFQSKKYLLDKFQSFLMKRGFSKAQTTFTLTGKQPRKLNAEDVTPGVVTQAMSNKTYKYLCRKKAMYLPSKTTIQKWNKDYLVRPGFLENSLR